MDGWEIIDQARELSQQGVAFAMATVVWRQAPSSGGLGSRAIVTAEGQVYGWIGGACAEPAVISAARRVIDDGKPSLLLLGTSEQFGASTPDGVEVVPISCQSEGALQVYIEPVSPAMRVVVVGRSPMAHTLVGLARALGWRADVSDAAEFSAANVDACSLVVIATQGHGDEEALQQALSALPAFVGLVASPKRAEAVLGYLADRGVPREALDRVQAPAGLDLGHTTHREIAVAILAELVKLRAAGAFSHRRASEAPPIDEARDLVCGMAVRPDASSHAVEHAGVTYYFCGVGCRDAFARDPDAYLSSSREV